MATRAPPTEFLRRRIAGQVRGFFNDHSKGQRPIKSSDEAFVARGSAAWRVHGDVTSMMVGGIAALLLQMLHPAALAGVWDHSDFNRNMHGRLRNTARFIAVTTYGHRSDAEAAIERVRRIHDHVHGSLPDGSPYDANDPRLLAWVHVAGGAMFLDSWVRFGEPEMSDADRDVYWADVAPVASLIGADPVPTAAAEAAEIIRSFVPELRCDDRTRRVQHAILRQNVSSLAAVPLRNILVQSAIDLLPPWARRMQDLRQSGAARPAVGLATRGIATTLRWALSPR